MLKTILPSSTAIGLEIAFTEIKGAEVCLRNGQPHILELFQLSKDSSDVKRLYKHQPILVTGLNAADVLIRPFYMALTKEKDIAAALAFQVEPLLPYPADQALLGRQTLSQNEEGTHLTLLSTHKELLKKHIEECQQLKFEPEKVASIQTALCDFGRAYVKTEKAYLILHLSLDWLTCILVQEGKLISAYTHHEGLDILYKAWKEELSATQINLDQIDFNALEMYPHLSEAVNRLQKGLAKIGYALMKDYKDKPLEGVLITGEIEALRFLDQKLSEKLKLPLLQCSVENGSPYSSRERQRYAMSIGLAIGSFQESIDFRQQEFIYPHPWKRSKIPLMAYFTLIFLLSTAFYFFSQVYLESESDKIKQEYVELLASMNKTHDQFESAFLAKNPQEREKLNGEIASVMQLENEDLSRRIEFLQKDLQATPDSFPLFANTPSVSDVLAWLSTHPYIVRTQEDGTVESRLQLENFSYIMLKRPMQGKKQEKYQIKVELEFSSPTPKWAREFHDALIAANDFVDPKGEVKWSSNRGHYRTSFYLKDKTLYHAQ